MANTTSRWPILLAVTWSRRADQAKHVPMEAAPDENAHQTSLGAIVTGSRCVE